MKTEDFWWQLPFEEPLNGEQREIHHLRLHKSRQTHGEFCSSETSAHYKRKTGVKGVSGCSQTGQGQFYQSSKCPHKTLSCKTTRLKSCFSKKQKNRNWSPFMCSMLWNNTSEHGWNPKWESTHLSLQWLSDLKQSTFWDNLRTIMRTAGPEQNYFSSDSFWMHCV